MQGAPVSALVAALAASVRAPHASTAARTAHTIWFEESGGGYAVRCIPHGHITWVRQGLAATLAALEHDVEQGGESL